MKKRESQPVEEELRPAHRIRRTFPKFMRYDRIGCNHQIVPRHPEPHTAFVVDVSALQLAIVPSARRFNHVAPRREAAARDNGRFNRSTWFSAPPANLERSILKCEAVADAAGAVADDRRRDASYFAIAQHIDHGTPPLRLQADMCVRVDDHVAAGLRCAEISGAGDAVVLNPVKRDSPPPLSDLL